MNSKGFITISVILFLPLLMSISFGTLFVLWLMNQKHSINNICSFYILNSQNTLVEANNELLKLNNLALGLIQQKRALNLIILSGPPPAKAAAKVKRALVIAQQKTLSLRQSSLLHLSNFKSKGQLTKLLRELTLKFNSFEIFWQKYSLAKPTYKVHWVPSQIKVEIKDIASTYVRAINHSQLQSLHVQWDYKLKNILPNWLLQTVPVSKVWTGRCSSHPIQGDKIWYAKIGMGKL